MTLTLDCGGGSLYNYAINANVHPRLTNLGVHSAP